jgi:hypothetical protein
MIMFSDWFPPAVVGVVFTTLGLLKIRGTRKRIVGGGDKPIACRLFGRCPGWSKQFNVISIAVILSIGVVNLGIFAMVLFKP